MRKPFTFFFLLACFLVPCSPFAAENGERSRPQRFFLEDVEVICIEDLATRMDLALFSGPAPEELRRKYMPEGSGKASVNVFVIKTAGEILLVDTGYGFLKPGSGMMAGLSDLGIKPEMVNRILLTHMHPDHIGGLITAQGKRVFPHAKVRVAEEEHDFWVKKARDRKNPAVRVARAYGKDLETFKPGEKQAAGVVAIAIPGHTPGHTAFLVQSGNGLLMVGDLLHAAVLQSALPDECASYDQAPDLAIRSRKAILFLAAANRLAIAGAHIPFPGIGHVVENGEGGFFFHEGME